MDLGLSHLQRRSQLLKHGPSPRPSSRQSVGAHRLGRTSDAYNNEGGTDVDCSNPSRSAPPNNSPTATPTLLGTSTVPRRRVRCRGLFKALGVGVWACLVSGRTGKAFLASLGQIDLGLLPELSRQITWGKLLRGGRSIAPGGGAVNPRRRAGCRPLCRKGGEPAAKRDGLHWQQWRHGRTLQQSG